MNPGPARLALAGAGGRLRAAAAALASRRRRRPGLRRATRCWRWSRRRPRRCCRWTWPACAPPPGPSRCWPGRPNAKRPVRAARARRGFDEMADVDTWLFARVGSAAAGVGTLELARGRFEGKRVLEAFAARRPESRTTSFAGLPGAADAEQALALLDARTLAFGPPALVRAAAARGGAGGAAQHPWLASVRGALDDEAGQGGRLAVVELAFVVQPDARNELAEVLGTPSELHLERVGGRLFLDRQARGVLVGVASQARDGAGRWPSSSARTSGRCRSASRSARWRWRPCCAGRPPPLGAPAWCWNWRSPRTNAPSSRTSWPPSPPCWPAPRSRPPTPEPAPRTGSGCRRRRRPRSGRCSTERASAVLRVPLAEHEQHRVRRRGGRRHAEQGIGAVGPRLGGITLLERGGRVWPSPPGRGTRPSSSGRPG